MADVWLLGYKSLVIERSQIKYARAGEHHIAYREYVGDPTSSVEIVMVNGFFFPIESLPDDPIANRLLEGLAGSVVWSCSIVGGSGSRTRSLIGRRRCASSGRTISRG